MPEKRIHKILKLVMVGVILFLAWILPGIWAEKSGRIQGKNPSGIQEEWQEKGDGLQRQPDKGTEGEAGESQQSQEKTSQEPEAGLEEKNWEKTRGRILIDPGHGGVDPGMVGIGGVEEKQINLAISRLLGEVLEEKGYEIIYTRTGDQGLYDEDSPKKKVQDIQRRCALIQEKKPLLSVSIHQNSYQDPQVYGPQVFYFEHSQEGKQLALSVQEQLNTLLNIQRPRVIKGNTNYYILKRSEGVTILVECSFLSNPEEAKKIQTPEYQQAVAEAIGSGVIKYLEGVGDF